MSITIFSIQTFSIGLIYDSQHKKTVIMLSVAFSYCYAECRYAKCRYAECRDSSTALSYAPRH